MPWLHSFKTLYSLDTLDTRCTIPATSPPRQAGLELQIGPARAGSSELGKASSGVISGPQASRPDDTKSSLWTTPEFYLYYFLFITIVPLMFKVSIDVSRTNHASHSKYSHLLSQGWIPGRKVDNSDDQYAAFRGNLPYLAFLLVVHPFCRRLYDSFWRIGTYTSARPAGETSHGLSHGLPAASIANVRLEQRISFDFWFAILYIIALHGFSAAKVLLILYLNFKIAKGVPKNYIPAAAWMFNVGILFANELCRGYPYAAISEFLYPSPMSEKSDLQPGWGTWLDSHAGLNPRWEVLFNITILRLISFNMDYYWSLNMRGGSPIEKKQLDPSNLPERDRVAIPAKPEDYSLRNYIAYVLYSPLYLTGPIITFNDYISQQRYQAPSIEKGRTVRYAIRFVVCLLTMELVLHYIYAVAIFKAKPDWDMYSPFQLSMLGYFNLHIIWLKLLLPWRFFRLWSLIDGIDPPENMVRCMSDNYSALAFWRAWHRSYNRWIVRYIFIPLGGSASKGLWGKVRSISNFLAVFTFVALWHDINLRLLMWGWLITLFVVPEIIATYAFPARSWRDRPTAYRWICGVGAVGNILMMMVANLVGFAIGVDGLKGLLHGIIGSTAGLAFLAGACGALFVGVQVMFEVREQEKREGIRMKC